MFKSLLIGLVVFMFCMTTPAQAASFEFATSELNAGTRCNQSLRISIDATGEESNAADIEIHYDPRAVVIIDADSTQDGVQISTGDAYESYAGNQVDTATGTIRLTAFSVGTLLNTQATFATINFHAAGDDVTGATFSILFNGAGNTWDSNIADASTSTDLLTHVQDAHVNFSIDGCVRQVAGVFTVKVSGSSETSTATDTDLVETTLAPRAVSLAETLPVVISTQSDVSSDFSVTPGLQAIATTTLAIAGFMLVFKFAAAGIEA